jgi:hypothetical protein
MFADNLPGQFYPEPPHGHAPGAYSATRFDRSTQPMNFMDFTISNINDWNWGVDLGNLIGPDGVPNIHPHMQGPPQGPG